MSTPGPVRRETAPHYRWGEGADGWHLAASDGLSVIEERMSAGAAEVPHYHQVARQVFYVLSGTLTMVLPGATHVLGPGAALEIPPGLAHQARNDGASDVEFLVVSAPSAQKDRVTAEI